MNDLVLKELQKLQNEFAAIVPFNPQSDKLIKLDFTEANHELNAEIVDDTQKFTSYINNKLSSSGARYGIGGYAEHRVVYSRSKIFDGSNTNEEPRRLHLGIDIWGKPYTAVSAPMSGIVHSFAFNDGFGDYGTTIILTHKIGETSIHTLYGHLSLQSIRNLHEGDRIGKGDVFAEFGIPLENGHWPPHLHFQLIIDLEGKKGDYPGVCKYSEREKYLSNCPNPDLVLNLLQYSK